MTTAHDLSRERHWVCARRLSERRHDLGLTQGDVGARLAALGTTATNRTLSAMEHGQGVDVGRLPELATALECTVTYLLGLTDNPDSWAPDRLAEATGASVDLRDAIAVVAGQTSSWILGPDIPERRTLGSDRGRA